MTGGTGVTGASGRAAGVLDALWVGLQAGRTLSGLPGGQLRPTAAQGVAQGVEHGLEQPGEPFLRACGARLGLCQGADPLVDIDPETVEFASVSGVLLGLATCCDPLQRQSEAVANAAPFTAAPLVATAAAVAAAVSAGLEQAAWSQRVALAAWGCEEGVGRGDYRPGPSLSARLTWACALAERAEADPVEVVGLLVGNSGAAQECVPAAFALAAVSPDAVAARRAAAALGGQVDVIGALAGALVAAGPTIAARPESLSAGAEAAGGEVGDTGVGGVGGQVGKGEAAMARLAAELTALRFGV